MLKVNDGTIYINPLQVSSLRKNDIHPGVQVRMTNGVSITVHDYPMDLLAELLDYKIKTMNGGEK